MLYHPKLIVCNSSAFFGQNRQYSENQKMGGGYAQ